ncbi:serine-rich adhesin for platelets isoform X3 [Phymastichus coffea]|uniref:serine-rich adhesin for platelets isoform X3 n=1 Tax=Phymastichus coffea TaxID=108790 RepID=UPI00273B0EEC|nr:serine-rich adhesin for platelets isoform X3 [Phymastichus coffea]
MWGGDWTGLLPARPRLASNDVLSTAAPPPASTHLREDAVDDCRCLKDAGRRQEKGKAMFGAKIRSWLDAQLARTRKKRKAAAPLQEHPTARAFFFERDFSEIFPALAISSSSFRPYQTNCGHHDHCPRTRMRTRTTMTTTTTTSTQQQQPSGNNSKNNAGNLKVKGNSAVNLSSPESAYSTGYSTDGTSPCATYAPEYYINVRSQKVADASRSCPKAPRGDIEHGRTDAGRLDEAIDEPNTEAMRARNRATYSLARRRYPEYEQQWRKPAPPPMACSSPKIQGEHFVAQDTCHSSGYPMQLFSPRRMPLVATTSTQVVPMRTSQRQRPAGRAGGPRATDPWRASTTCENSASSAAGPWSRQQSNVGLEYACRQESLSVGRSPVNWCPRQQQQRNHQQRSSSTSSCSSRSRSCSLSSSSSSNSSSNRPASSPSSSDDITLNEVMGKYDDNYLYEKETDLMSEPRETTNGASSSANFSSASASASSLDLQLEFAAYGEPRRRSRSSSRSSSRNRLGYTTTTTTTTTTSRPRRSRRHSQRRRLDGRESANDDSVADQLDEKEHREELELLQEALSRRLKKNSSESSAQTSRALLERLLMKNSSAAGEAVAGGGRRAWSSAMRPAAASRSVGGTPICSRRRTSPRPALLSPLTFSRQLCPAESTSSMKHMSASEMALIEADKEADLKYEQLIMEAERMLINVQQQLQRDESSASTSRRDSTVSVTVDHSPSRLPRVLYHQQQNCIIAPNKRVELIKNAELNIELALSKSRNSQPELSCGSIKDLLGHSSPKRLLQQQQKKMIEPMVQSVVMSTLGQTTDNDRTGWPSMECSAVAEPARPSSTAPGDEAEHRSCPQSEPLRRKVYDARDDSSRLLLQRQAASNTWLRNSDSDCAHDQSQMQSYSAASSCSQLRKQMLLETLQSLKQSLEDQSAALKLNCLRPL